MRWRRGHGGVGGIEKAVECQHGTSCGELAVKRALGRRNELVSRDVIHAVQDQPRGFERGQDLFVRRCLAIGDEG